MRGKVLLRVMLLILAGEVGRNPRRLGAVRARLFLVGEVGRSLPNTNFEPLWGCSNPVNVLNAADEVGRSLHKPVAILARLGSVV